ncbi:hypothetical protein XccvBFoX4_gp71c [Xanthomonas phage FoX4]|uniref:DUF7609 domain-containing protein n=1 Tax=Xanthomonas phage FoX4 TaxID=2723900 RepID=A0A858WND8_9CAUD|nr:hypothetical protein KNU97_gp71 [Xanthomonas phage FoX4]QJI53025.1 hypothetical protein XccvBFoX4_gp71c [Xanthomonas phage FoX4]
MAPKKQAKATPASRKGKPGNPPVNQLDAAQLQTIANINTGSLPNRIAALDVGQSISDTLRLDMDQTGRQQINDHLARMQRIIGSAMHRAKTRTGHEYITERANTFTTGGDVLLFAVVTRIA